MVLKDLPSESNSLWKVFKESEQKKNEPEYKTYKKLFEAIKKNETFLILFLNTNITKESIGKGKYNHQSFPKKIKLDRKNITDEDLIAKEFNTYFAEIRPKLAKTI